VPHTRHQFMASSRGDAAAYDGPAGSARDQRSVSDGSRAHPRLGHLDFADFHLRDAGAERDTRGLDLLPEGPRLRLQVGGVLVGTDPNDLVLRPIDPGRHDRPADLVMDRLGLLFEVLDKKMFQTCGSATLSWSERTINASEGSDDYRSVALPRTDNSDGPVRSRQRHGNRLVIVPLTRVTWPC